MANVFSVFKDAGENSILPFESGSNSNGNWIKFADGTMIEWGSTTITTPGTTSTSGLITKAHYAVQKTVSFPVAFASPPATSINFDGNSEYHFMFAEKSTVNAMYFRAVASTGNYTFDCCWLAVGRWK